ncbi:AraC family transcriptional regulator [Tissierella sp. MB52-C2]|uniref:AraC family transcriptional regulator n=1 Tax=Tissierella sp. MB52-C2 TaxID=3070999 RepID=UPI00280C237E|nr:AraC family transcriptional regulator [Tissierella sp. MB52-C2]WMM26323.1 AraC family transcriptional regulator [Tissierella sp. MB52-C2]
MDCIQSIQKAIEYMEEHILENINYEDVSRQVYMSNYHFHRIFSMITGITANEYIRNRKLSMAGQELIMSDKKVIDIAMKYGYDSPESFTKAFSRFHGITPIVAKRSGMQLKSFNRLVMKIKLEGGTVMKYKIVEKEEFKLLAKVNAFRNESISEEGNTEIPDFWKQCGENGVFDVLTRHTIEHDVYGVCAPISKESTHFDYGIAMKYDGEKIPEGYKLWHVKPTLWVVFECIGDDEGCIGETWDRIFKEFLPSSDYNMLDDTDFELYPENNNSDCFCEIWIPVEKK